MPKARVVWQVLAMSQEKLKSRSSAPRTSSPQAVRSDIERTRLVDEITNSDASRVTVLHAPAGYGKTTLLKQCCAEFEAQGTKTVLITLDRTDQDIRNLFLKLGKFIPPFISAEAAEIQEFGFPHTVGDEPLMLCLDNVGHICDFPSEALLERLVEQDISNLGIVIATRVRPEIGIPRLELSDEIKVLGADALAFDAAETSAFFASAGTSLPEQILASLANASEGWPAVLRLWANALQAERGGSHDFIVNGDVSTLHLNAYLHDEILRPLTDEVRDFLTQIAPLIRFTSTFAAELTGDSQAPLHMKRLEKSGCIYRVDSSATKAWYRLHPLLGRFLEQVLRETDPERLSEVHQAAITWNESEGRLSDATRHAFAAGNNQVAAELLQRASLERRRVGKPTMVSNWSQHLSDEAFERYPLLHTEAACSFATGFAMEAARMHANSAHKRFADLEPLVRDDLLAVDALIALYDDQPEHLIEISDRGLRDVEMKDPYTVGTLLIASALGNIAASRLERAKHAAVKAKAENERAENLFGMSISYMTLGLVHSTAGELPLAIEHWQKADATIQSIASFGYTDKIAYGYLPAALFEQNKIAEAEEYLARSLAGPTEIMTPDMLTSVFLTASRLQKAKGDSAAAWNTLEDATSLALEKDWFRLKHAVEWERIRLLIRDNDLDEARRLRLSIARGTFQEHPGVLTHGTELEAADIGNYRLEILTAPNPAILSSIQVAINNALSGGRRWRAAKLLTLEAMCRSLLGDQNAALRSMSNALQIGASGRLVRTFVDEGAVVISLVRSIRKTLSASESESFSNYVDQILSAVGDAAIPVPDEAPIIVEPLSERELDVLNLVFHGCSNAEAAKRLFVSENTIKWHLQHVYSKLGVRNRTAAVAAARALNLVH